MPKEQFQVDIEPPTPFSEQTRYILGRSYEIAQDVFIDTEIKPHHVLFALWETRGDFFTGGGPGDIMPILSYEAALNEALADIGVGTQRAEPLAVDQRMVGLIARAVKHAVSQNRSQIQAQDLLEALVHSAFSLVDDILMVSGFGSKQSFQQYFNYTP